MYFARDKLSLVREGEGQEKIVLAADYLHM